MKKEQINPIKYIREKDIPVRAIYKGKPGRIVGLALCVPKFRHDNKTEKDIELSWKSALKYVLNYDNKKRKAGK